MTPHGVKLIRNLAELPDALRGGAVAIGNFDGVHLGHAAIARRLVEAARAAGGPAVVFTFDPHPVRILRPEAAPPPLTWTDRKAELLGQLGVDAVIAYPTDTALLELSAEDFFQRIVVDRLRAKRNGRRDEFLFRTRPLGHDRRAAPAQRRGGHRAGSGRAGDDRRPAGFEFASAQIACRRVGRRSPRLLTQPYRVRGMVRHGAGRGAKLGFPTANVDAIDTLLAGPRRVCGPRGGERLALAGGDQYRAQSDIRRAGDEGRSTFDRLSRVAVRRAAGG